MQEVPIDLIEESKSTSSTFSAGLRFLAPTGLTFMVAFLVITLAPSLVTAKFCLAQPAVVKKVVKQLEVSNVRMNA